MAHASESMKINDQKAEKTLFQLDQQDNIDIPAADTPTLQGTAINTPEKLKQKKGKSKDLTKTKKTKKRKKSENNSEEEEEKEKEKETNDEPYND